MFSQPRLQAAGERLVREQCIEMHRDLWHTDLQSVGRDGGMQIGQRRAVVEPFDFWHEAVDELQDAIGAIEEAFDQLMRIDAKL